jgi:hypothetical protein
MSDMAISAGQAALESDEPDMAAIAAAPPLWLQHIKIASLTAAGVLFSSALGVLLFLR